MRGMENMNDIRYLLSIEELLKEATKDALYAAAFEKLDSERQRKVKSIANEKKRAESMGAGLLLQMAVQELTVKCEPKDAGEAANQGDNVQLFSVSELLSKLQSPIAIEYVYGENGKPAFRSMPWHFNLSHSGEYVFLVVSGQEVGVDIQYKRSFYNERILRRFFSKEEQTLWETCEKTKDREELFYRMWIRKEAYGKLTGDGILKNVQKNVMAEKEVSRLGICFEHFEVLSDYQMAVCKWAEKESCV